MYGTTVEAVILYIQKFGNSIVVDKISLLHFSFTSLLVLRFRLICHFITSPMGLKI